MKTEFKPLIWSVAVALVFAFEYNQQNQEIQTRRPRPAKISKKQIETRKIASIPSTAKLAGKNPAALKASALVPEKVNFKEEITAGRNKLKEAPVKLASVFQKHPSQMKNMEKVSLRLEKGLSLNRTALKIRGEGNFTWIGRVEGQKSSLAVMTYMNGFFAGTFQTEEGLYTVEYNHRKQQYVMRKFDVFHHGNDARDSSPLGSMAVASAKQKAKAKSQKVVADQAIASAAPGDMQSVDQATDAATGDIQVDVMFGYAQDTYSSAADENSVIAKIQNAVAFTNQMYVDSLVKIQLNIVHVFRVNYSGSSDMATDLDRWAKSNDGYMDEAHTLRNQYSADLYSLITDNRNSSVIGIAYYPGGSYQGSSNITLDYIGTTVVGHEFGHNFGLAHESGGSPGYAYARPHNFSNYYTVMWSSYRGTSQSIPHFSNPNVLYKGLPTGVADQKEEARALNNSGQRIADFKKGSSTPSPTTTTMPSPTTTTMPSPTTTTQPPVQAPRITSVSSNQSIRIGESTSLQVVATGSNLSYQWKKGTANVSNSSGISGARTATLSITNAQASHSGSYSVVVSNTGGSVTSSAVQVTVASVQAPTANAGNDKANLVGDTVDLDGSQSSDPQGLGLSYSWVQTAGPNVMLSGASSSRANFKASAVGTYIFQLTVSNGTLSAQDSVSVTVSEQKQVDDVKLGVKRASLGYGYSRYLIYLETTSAVLSMVESVKYEFLQNNVVQAQITIVNASWNFAVSASTAQHYQVRATIKLKDGTQRIIYTNI